MKACPFCGKSVATVIDSTALEPVSRPGFMVVCDATNYVLGEARLRGDKPPGGCGVSTGWHATDDGAIKAWNMRASTTFMIAEWIPVAALALSVFVVYALTFMGWL